MKFYVSADLEGITGIVNSNQTNPVGDTRVYQEALDMMGRELGWLCSAIWTADEEAEIVVNDAHCRMNNLDVLQLPESMNISLISGKPKDFAMMHGLDKSFDAALLIGYHAKAGSLHGVLAHTFHHHISDLSINGQSLGEAGVNSIYASLIHQTPVILVSGDQVLAQEVHHLMPETAFVQTKVSRGFAVAECFSAAAVEESYYVTIEKLFESRESWKAMQPAEAALLKGPFTLDLTLTDPLAGDIVSTLPMFERVDGCSLRTILADFTTLYRTLQSAYSLLGYADYQR